MNLATLQDTLQKRILSTQSPQPGDPLGLLIYHNAYRARLLACLKDTFEHTCDLLGVDLFETIALAYLETHPSQDANLGNYGHGFAAFIKAWANQISGNQIRYLAGRAHTADAAQDADCAQVAELAHNADWAQTTDLAKAAELAVIDWTMRRCFDSRDCEPQPIQALAEIAPESVEAVIFHCVPSLTLGMSQFNAASQWLGLQQKPQTEYWKIWRKGLSPHLQIVTAEEHTALIAMIHMTPLGEIGKQLESTAGDKAADLLGAFLAQWFADGLIADLEIQNERLE